jgi:hypothetical protein
MTKKVLKQATPAEEKAGSLANNTNTTTTTKTDKKDNTQVQGMNCPCKCGCDELNITFKAHDKH